MSIVSSTLCPGSEGLISIVRLLEVPASR